MDVGSRTIAASSPGRGPPRSRRRRTGGSPLRPSAALPTLALACLVATSGAFRAAPGRTAIRERSSVGKAAPWASSRPLAALDRSRRYGRAVQLAGIRRREGAPGQGRIGDGVVRAGHFGGAGVGLFPCRGKPTRDGAMTVAMSAESGASGSDPSNSDSSSDRSPLVRVLLSFRRLIARLWSLLLKPFQFLRKADKSTQDDEPIQEEVAITTVENIAAVEEDLENIETTTLTSDIKRGEKVELTATDQDMPKDVTVPTPTPKEPATVATTKTTAAVSIDSATESRQATSSANVDLTGNWTLIVDEPFTTQYDEYLRKLGQPLLVRAAALAVIGSTHEETVQSEGGRNLLIRGTNVRGSWERTLEASGPSEDEKAEEGEELTGHAVEGHVLRPMTTADGERVEVASWWEGDGSAHRSWVVGGEKYGGGDFENRRYLTDGGNILVCESTFHPQDEGREEARVTWRFLREGAIYGDAAVVPKLPNIFDVLKKDERGDDEALRKGDVIVGDIMDDVATSSDEAAYKLSTPDEKSFDVNIDMVEEAIEREGWVPPSGDRWAISAPGIDLSGKWKLIITDKFKMEYDDFLRSLGQPLIVRGAAVVLVGNTREETKQRDGGRTLYIKGINAKGIWERTLVSSGSDFDTTMFPNPRDGKYDHVRVPIETADSERVVAESWWERDGAVHVSWTYNVKKYGGGAFESKRYLENDGDVYVCESTFHPSEQGREKSFLKWKFLREGAAFMLSD
ncbi:hypothetical protein ACHAWF_018389 [Thalassiosira exigua]